MHLQTYGKPQISKNHHSSETHQQMKRAALTAGRCESFIFREVLSADMIHPPPFDAQAPSGMPSSQPRLEWRDCVLYWRLHY
eukprot:1130647-Rhodomonas_salina.4